MIEAIYVWVMYCYYTIRDTIHDWIYDTPTGKDK